MPSFHSYVAIGDSFSEGVGDELPDGRVRGWADLVAIGLAAATPPVRYANLAIRGRLLAPIVSGQLDAAIELRPELLSINGGGNDIMRPRVSIEGVAARLIDGVRRATDEGIHVLLVSGANPSRHLPLGATVQRRGDRLAEAVRSHLPLEGVTWVDNWADRELGELRYWSVDKLHLNALGHSRVAGNVLAALEVPAPPADDGLPELLRPGTAAYWRQYVLPWVGRRLTGRSSGDTREPKIPTLEPVESR
ncbi:MAG TPA: SGNH/GDSL hydrolase family protein [Rhodoglobus sp.]|nr:SGNH/GDSL hydrolase family protein [Rhodoglobus sp.]